MKEIRIYFADFWPAFHYEDNFIVSALQDRYKIIIDSVNPNYLFYSTFGSKNFHYKNTVKIYFTGENDVPDFNLCDYGIGSSLLNFGDRYFRLPIYTLYDAYEDILVGAQNFVPLQQTCAQRKFCNFVYSNNQKADPMRVEFFNRLSQYKHVDSGGRYLNNIGGPVADKLDFIKDYKFTIAFENSSVPGYTTEKLTDPMQVNSMPIYWGNAEVENDFDTESFINVMDYNSMDEVIEEIIRLDNDDAAYLEKLSRTWIKPDQATDFKQELSNFLSHIIEQPLDKAKRTTVFGYHRNYRKAQFLAAWLYNNNISRPLLKRLIK